MHVLQISEPAFSPRRDRIREHHLLGQTDGKQGQPNGNIRRTQLIGVIVR
jgi:hypothetical protein